MHEVWGLGANSLPVPKPTLATLKEYLRLPLVSAGLLLGMFQIGFRRCVEKGYLEIFLSCCAPGHQDWTVVVGCGSLLDCDAY